MTAITDSQIEDLVIKHGGKWDGDAWVIHDADLHPFVRTLIHTTGAEPAGELPPLPDFQFANEAGALWGRVAMEHYARQAIAQSKRVQTEWTLEQAESAAHEAGFAGDSWWMGPEELALLLTRASVPAPQAAQPTPAQPVNQVLLEALGTIEHSMVQAKIYGNDVRREINFSHSVAAEAIAQAQTAQPEIDCRQCKRRENYDVAICKTCTNGDKFVKLPAVQLWRNG